MTKNLTAQRLRRWTILVIIFGLSVFIMRESWAATAYAADLGGRPHPREWPVVLEGLLALLMLVYWDARSMRRPHAWAAQVTMWIVTLTTSWVQILAAPQTWIGWITAGATPIALSVAIEWSLWLLYGNVDDHDQADDQTVDHDQVMTNADDRVDDHDQAMANADDRRSTVMTNADDQALRRAKNDHEKFNAVITARKLDHDQVMKLAEERKWPVANGSRT